MFYACKDKLIPSARLLPPLYPKHQNPPITKASFEENNPMDNRQLFARRGRSRQHLARNTILQSPHCSPHTLGRHSAYPHATPFTNDSSHPS